MWTRIEPINSVTLDRLTSAAKNAETQFLAGMVNLSQLIEVYRKLEEALIPASILYRDSYEGRSQYAIAMAKVFGMYGAAERFSHEREHAETAFRFGLSPDLGIMFYVDGNGEVHPHPFIQDHLCEEINGLSIQQIRDYISQQREVDQRRMNASRN